MNIDEIRRTNQGELKQIALYDYVVVGDSARRAREIEWLLAEIERVKSCE